MITQQPSYWLPELLPRPFSQTQLAPSGAEPAPFAPNQLDFALLASLYPTSPGPPTLANELRLETTDHTFSSLFFSPPVLANCPLHAPTLTATEPSCKHLPSRLLPSAVSNATRHSSPTLEGAKAGTRSEKAWQMHWTAIETDSALEMEQAVDRLSWLSCCQLVLWHYRRLTRRARCAFWKLSGRLK